MSSRLKERGGAGAKIMASDPSKTPALSNHRDKLSSLRFPLAASQKELPRPNPAARLPVPRFSHPLPASCRKENPRPISVGRPSIARTSATAAGKENPRPLSAVRASVLKKEPAARFSTSSMPRGKFTDFLNNGDFQVASFGERSSFSGARASHKGSVGKGQVRKGSNQNFDGKSVNVVTGDLSGRRSYGCLDAKADRTGYKVLDGNTKKTGCRSEEFEARISGSASHPNQVDRTRNNEGKVSEVHKGVVLIEVPLESGQGNSTMGSNSSEDDLTHLTDDVKLLDDCQSKEIVDCNMEKYCLNSHPEGQDNTSEGHPVSQDECSNTSLAHAHHKSKAIQPDLESKCANGYLGAEIEEVCNDLKYPSKLHEKLALLEDKVQKIALEIKQTKDMLDRNKPSESGLVLSDICKKVSSVEKVVGNIKDGAKFELFSSYSDKFNYLQDCCVASNLRDKGNSLSSLKSLNHAQLEARFFPHNKLSSDHILPIASMEMVKNSEPACPELSSYQQVDDGLVEENPIAAEFLSSLREELHNPKMPLVNTQLMHGMLNKMKLERTSSAQCVDLGSTIDKQQQDVALETSERIEEFDTFENTPPSLGTEESSIYQLSEIGWKVSTGGWFVSEGEAVLLAHDDNSCSYYDIANSEVKSEYKPPAECPTNLWGDCWLIRAPGIDGCSGRYVVAATAGNSLESGFCSWDYYTKDIKAFQVAASPGTALPPMARNPRQTSSLPESRSCWYRPCGPLLISTSSRQKAVCAYDIRDGDLVMAWEVSSAVAEMEYCSPIQWRNRGKVIIAEREAITLWDVNSLTPQPTLSVSCAGKRIHSLHVNNTDAEMVAGVRQRASSAEVEGNDGAFCTQDSINVFDFRIPSGVGLKLPRHGANALSMFSIGDSLLVGSTEGRLAAKGSPRSNIEHFSLRKGSIVTMYRMPEFNSHYHHSAITQVWGNSNVAMGICGMGLHVFDAFKDESSGASSSICEGSTKAAKETIGPDDLFRPTFDYVESRALVISRDRPAFWRYLS